MFIAMLSENHFSPNASASFSFFPAMFFQDAPSTPVVYLLFAIMIVGFCAPLVLVAGLALRWYRNQWLLVNGEAAQAKILKVWETGATVNEQPQVGLLLEVYAANRPVFRGEAKRVVSILNISRIQVGATVDVRFDPQNPSRIAVVL